MKNIFIKFMKHKIKYSFIVLLGLLLLFYIYNFATIFDEDYTLVLIHNSIPNIIKFDSLDVHPPLYYLLLKCFLKITTFWTDSFLIKILFARIFSVFISIIIFIFLIKIIHLYKIKNKFLILFLMFLMIPGVISFTYEFTKIRMYTLSAMFVVIQFYELIKFNKDFKNIRLLFITILLVLSEYTNYYSAAISGFLMLIYLSEYFIKYKKLWTKLLYPLLLMISAFVPWIPELFKQFSLQKYHQLPPGILKQWIATFVFVIIFVYPLIWAKKHMNHKFYITFFNSFITMLLLFIFMSLVSILYRPVFQFRYFFPIFVIYGFLSLNSIYFMLKIHYLNISKIYSIVLTIVLMCTLVGAYIDQVDYFNIPSLSMPGEFHYWDNLNKKKIYLKPVSNTDDGFDLEKVIYLSRINKEVKTPNVKKALYNPSYRRMFSHINSYLSD